MSKPTISSARAMVMHLRSSGDSLAGVWRNPNEVLTRGPGIVSDIAGELGIRLSQGSVGEFYAGLQALAQNTSGNMGALGAIPLVAQFIGTIVKFTGWLKGEFADAAEQTRVNYGAAQAFLMSWVPLQGVDTFTVSELPGFNAHNGQPDAGGFYLFVRPLQGEKNDRSDFYGDPLHQSHDWLLKLAGITGNTPLLPEEAIDMSHGCQNAVELLAGGTCSVNDGMQVFWPILFPLYSPARLWSYYSRWGEPVAAIATAANMLVSLTPQHIAQREALVDRAEKVLRAVVATQYPATIETPDGWVNRPDKQYPEQPRFSLASANTALARCRQFRTVRESLKRARVDFPVLLPPWALYAMDMNVEDFG